MLFSQSYLTAMLAMPTQNNINERAKYTANTGMVSINTANANLDGTGSITTLLTAASNGTQIKSVTIKSINSTTSDGMIRFFVFNGASYYIIDEIVVPPSKKSTTYPAFQISYDLEYSLIAGYAIAVSTEVAETFIISMEAQDWTY
jgi:hypothetical protein